MLQVMLFAGWALLWAAPQPPPAAKPRIEVTLERFAQGRWTPVEPGLVLARGDRVRFRFRSSFDGYLYVTAAMTSGTSSLLFPRDETGLDNRIVAGRDYLVPATAAWFRIEGPPGHDVTYWLASPVPLGEPKQYVPPSPPPAERRVPGRLLPRCDDAVLRARGDCVDSSAGLKARDLGGGGDVPGPWAGLARKAPRDVVVLRRESATVVSAPGPLSGPLVYEFRIAHL